MNKSQLLSSLKSHGFSNKILDAFSKVLRENFVPENLKSRAYEDTALPIGHGQTISQPYTIATMLKMLDLNKGQKVLEIGSGCGYVLALLSEILGKDGKVYGVEIVKELVEVSMKNLKDYRNIKVYNKDGGDGLKEETPFDRILISAAIERIPEKILQQLKEGGILVAPVGSGGRIYGQTLIKIQRKKNEFLIKEKIPGFAFVRFV